MSLAPNSNRVAVIDPGMAGAACVAGLRGTNAAVNLLEKPRNVGGRAATRHAGWLDASGAEQAVTFDHDSQCFAPDRPRFKAAMARATAANCLSEWPSRMYAALLAEHGQCLAVSPTMSALRSPLLAGETVRLNCTVRRLQRAADGGWYVAADGAPVAGPFRHAALATPPAQAVVPLAGHQGNWAEPLMAKHMQPCRSLLAVTDDVDWPWDAAEPERGPLGWVLRNDLVPGRTRPLRPAAWTAHLTAEWSAAHLEDESESVNGKLQLAPMAQLPATSGGSQPARWHHTAVHRWRYAEPAFGCDDSFDSDEAWWNDPLGLGVRSDSLAGGGVEAAWHSGDELVDFTATSIDRREAEPYMAAVTR